MKKGFSILELAAVITIIGILSLLIIPNIVKLYNNSITDSMKLTEAEVLDASRIYIEDYCKNPIDNNYKSHCNSSLKEMNSGKKYICLSSIQAKEVIKEVYYNDSISCRGIILFNNDNLNNGKVYLKCGNDYLTDGIDDYLIYINEC